MTVQISDFGDHRRKADLECKSVSRFESDTDDIWRIWFTDGTAFAIQFPDAINRQVRLSYMWTSLAGMAGFMAGAIVVLVFR